MAQSLYQFDIDDDSPEIAYFPFANREPSTNVSAGWQLSYSGSGAATSPGQVGVGTSYHYTSLDGASLMINWTGTGIDLLGSVNNALYNISLDGIPSAYFADPAQTVLASLNDLPNTNHSLLLTTIITNTTSPDAFLTFDKARVTYAPPAGFLVNTTATSQAIVDSDIAFMGAWSYVTDRTGNAMHMSSSAGDHAETNFSGSAITVYGLTSSYSGNFTVTLDNTTTSLSALSSYNDSDTLLFYATDLPMNISHRITVVNQENRTLALRVGGLNITSFGNVTTSPTSSTLSASIPAGTIAAAVLAAVLLLVITGILYYACWMRQKARARNQPTFLRGVRKRFKEQGVADVERVTNATPSSCEELESTNLSTSKGYGFGLGLRRGFPFAYRKGKTGSNSSGKSRNGAGAQAESHPMTPQYDRDEKRYSASTLTEDLPLVPESEKLAPGWSNPVARTPPSFKYTRHYKDVDGILLPELRVAPTGPIDDDDDDDDADVKTLTSRQDETLAATLLLSPRISEALGTFDRPILSRPDVNAPDRTKQPRATQQPQYLHKRDSRTTNGSGGSTWSKVRTRLYRKAHRDDGKQRCPAGKQESSSSSPESVPVVMHESGSAHPPGETSPDSGTYSFLDFTSSHVSLRPHSKTTTLSSTPAELGHAPREASRWSENTSIRMVRIERSRDDMAPKPDAPSTASGGSQPSTIRVLTQLRLLRRQLKDLHPSPPPVDDVAEGHPTSSPAQYLQIPQIAPPELTHSPANSPTESVPFSVSEIYFRHSFSDYAGFDSQRGSVSSALPPHPPLPHRDGSQAGTPTYPQPPPYIVQRVLGLQMSPLSPLSPSVFAASRATLSSPTISVSRSGRPGAASPQSGTFRVGSLLGPRPRPSTPGSIGSIRGSAAPQLPMQGGRGNLRSSR
ncbi:hypothetical protein JVT61DRAFT_3100 [Boletus reticuloceps]|uniref:Uncharacterized protein n=1 Tax=Boletus reticuloceps TaxID=495285 RepID=A0A8I2YPA6_9AGAM|nr:hypothetical protein JVT61DRAFT_3100 [Boletus reticuloceps]